MISSFHLWLVVAVVSAFTLGGYLAAIPRRTFGDWFITGFLVVNAVGSMLMAGALR